MLRPTLGLLVTLILGLCMALLAAAAPPAGKVWRISFLAPLPGEEKTTLMQALLDRLHDLGYRKGQTMIFTYRSADGRPERLPPLARELVQASPTC